MIWWSLRLLRDALIALVSTVAIYLLWCLLRTGSVDHLRCRLISRRSKSARADHISPEIRITDPHWFTRPSKNATITFRRICAIERVLAAIPDE